MIKMNCLYIPLLLCMLTTGILCDNLSEAVRKTCNFNMSQYSSLNDQEEFKLCKQFNVTSVISNEQISDENMVNVRCKLYYESLVSMCLVNDSREKFWTLLKTSKTDNVTIEDVCNNTLSIKPESMFVHNFIQKNEPCKHFCLDYRRGQPVLSSICAKSYMFDKEMDLINTKTVPRQEESMTEKIGINNVEVNSNEGESDHKPIASDDENKDPITTPNIEEPSDKIKENLNSDVSKPNVETASNNQPKVEELNVSMNKPAKLTPKVPVAAVNEQITKIEEQNLRNQYTDNYFDDDQQAPPTNPQVDDKNAEDKIPENMEKNDRKTKLDKELKRPDPLMDAQDGNIEDDEEDEEAIPDKCMYKNFHLQFCNEFVYFSQSSESQSVK